MEQLRASERTESPGTPAAIASRRRDPNLRRGPAPYRGGLLLTAALCVLWLLPGMWGREPWKPDEAYTLGIVYDFLHGSSPWIPMLGGTPFMEKPPLYFWTAAGFSRLFSAWLPFDEAARFATAFFMAITLVCIWAAARDLYERHVAQLAPLVFIASLGLAAQGHELLTDNGLLAGFAVAAYGLTLARRRPVAGGALLGLGTGVGFLCKGLIAPGVLGIAFVLLPLACAEYRRRWSLIAVTAAVTALPFLVIWPWEVYRYSPALFDEWLWSQNVDRYFHGEHMGGGYDPYYYLKTVPWATLPALPLALFALWHRRARWRTAQFALPLLLVCVLFAVLQFSRAVSETYLLPALIPLAWLGAVGASRLPRVGGYALETSAWVLFGALAALLWSGWWVYATGHPLGALEYLYRLLPRGVMSLSLAAFTAACAYTLLWLMLPPLAGTPGERGLLRWVTGISLSWCLAMTLWLPVLNSSKSYRTLLDRVAAAVPANPGCVASIGVGDSSRGMLDYYENLHTYPSDNPQPRSLCRFLLVETRDRAMPALDGWLLLWDGERADDAGGAHFWLMSREPPLPGNPSTKTASLPPSEAARGTHRR